jgi:hypothetical protein
MSRKIKKGGDLLKIEISYSKEENRILQCVLGLLKPMMQNVKKSENTNGKYRKARIYLNEKVLH